MSELSILFWLRKNRLRARDGKCPISCRLSMDGKPRAEISTKQWVEPERWEYKMIDPDTGEEKLLNDQKVQGSTEDAKTINNRLNTIRNKVTNIYNKLDSSGELVTPASIKLAYEGKTIENHTLLQAFDFTLNKMNDLVSKKKKKKSTVDRYEYTKQNVARFIKYKYKKSDIFLKDMITRGRPEFSFASSYEHWGKTVRLEFKEDGKNKVKKIWNNNYCKKELSRINTILVDAVKEGCVDRNPFAGVQKKGTKSKPKYLTSDQVQLIIDTPVHSESLQKVKDIFLFCCYTSLAYAEVKKLSYDHFAYSIEGHDWIFINRKKNEEEDGDPGKICKIPLLLEANKYLEKYKEDPICLSRNVALPVMSLKCYNESLKIIQQAANEEAARRGLQTRITGKFSSHIARHTCSRWLLDLGFSKEFVAEIFGHTTTKLIGEIYGEVTPKRMSREIQRVESQLGGQLQAS